MSNSLVIRVALFSLLLLVGCSAGPPDGVPTVAIVSFSTDPTIDSAVQGVRDGLADLNYEDGETVRVLHTDAQGDMATIRTIVDKYVAQGVDIIMPMTTPCLVTTATVVEGTDQLVVFTVVYDPYRAGVANSPTDHPPNLVGVASPPPVEPTMDMIVRLLPDVQRLGVIYNPGEANALASLERYRASAGERGMTLVERTVAASSEVQQAAQSLVGQIDAFIGIGDNTVGLAFEAIVGVADSAGLPVISNDLEWVERGATIAVGSSWYEAGRAGGHMVAEVLDGSDPADMAITVLEAYELALNMGAAERHGVTIPPDIVEEAALVIE